MRRFHVRELEDAGPPVGMTDEALQLWVDSHGARVAAWIVHEYRKAFRVRGVVDFRIPRNLQTPPYFRIGIEKLRQSKHWRVDVLHEVTTRCYRVTWLRWRANRPANVLN